MITLLVIFFIFMLIGFGVAIITGIIAVSPAVLVVLALVTLDVLMFKLIFKRKKKETDQ